MGAAVVAVVGAAAAALRLVVAGEADLPPAAAGAEGRWDQAAAAKAVFHTAGQAGALPVAVRAATADGWPAMAAITTIIIIIIAG